MTMTVPNARAAVVQLAWSSSLRVWVSLSQVLPLAGTPSIPDRLPMISETPTPDRNPASTGWEIRSARNSSFATANSSRNTAVRIASTPTAEAYSAVPWAATSPAPAATRAAVAESAPTTSCREEPIRANISAGSSAQYRPVWIGRPAIFAYPRLSGIAIAATVTPAITSPRSQLPCSR